MFSIKVTDIFKIDGKGQVICGPANEENFQGTLRCENKVFRVIGYPVFDRFPENQKCYLLDTFDLTDEYIEKIFVEEERIPWTNKNEQN